MHERFRCGGASLGGQINFPKYATGVRKKGQGWERSGDLSQKILVTRATHDRNLWISSSGLKQYST